MPYQLSRHLRIRGVCAFSQEELAARLSDVAQRLYADSPDNPYLSEDDVGQPVMLDCREVGFTPAVMNEFCKDIGCAVHVLWGNAKIESYVPPQSKFETICYIVYGDHAYFIEDAATKAHIAKMGLNQPAPHSEFLVAKPSRGATGPAARLWEEYGGIKPGHFLDLRLAGCAPRPARGGRHPQSDPDGPRSFEGFVLQRLLRPWLAGLQ